MTKSLSASVDRAVTALASLFDAGWSVPAIRRAVDVSIPDLLAVSRQWSWRRLTPEARALTGDPFERPWELDTATTADVARKLSALAEAPTPPSTSGAAPCRGFSLPSGRTLASEVGLQLDRLRAGGWSVPAIARASGVPLRTVQNVEAGQRTTSSIVAERLRQLDDQPPT